ncbi:hypothetical protein ACLKA6_018678 [Drosophila palustris]
MRANKKATLETAAKIVIQDIDPDVFNLESDGVYTIGPEDAEDFFNVGPNNGQKVRKTKKILKISNGGTNKQKASPNWQLISIEQQQQQQAKWQNKKNDQLQKITNCHSRGKFGMLQQDHQKLASTQLQHLGNERSIELQNLHTNPDNASLSCLTSPAIHCATEYCMHQHGCKDQQKQKQMQQHQHQLWSQSPITNCHSTGSNLVMQTQHPRGDFPNCQALAASTISPQFEQKSFGQIA